MSPRLAEAFGPDLESGSKAYSQPQRSTQLKFPPSLNPRSSRPHRRREAEVVKIGITRNAAVVQSNCIERKSQWPCEDSYTVDLYGHIVRACCNRPFPPAGRGGTRGEIRSKPCGVRVRRVFGIIEKRRQEPPVVPNHVGQIGRKPRTVNPKLFVSDVRD